MILKDLLTKETWDKFGDMDVYNDCTDDDYPAWCGNTLTEEGLEHFQFALGCEAEIFCDWTGSPAIKVLIDHRDDWRTALMATQHLFEDMCGYCTEEEYNAWFID